jgi:inosine-uridine nucleoside N-ribohydrolase
MRKSPFLLVLFMLSIYLALFVQNANAGAARARVIFDTDIGDDIDDAYALALLLKSPEVKILGVTTAFGDTHLRARLVSRLLEETGNASIPVFAGPVTKVKNGPSQAAWALRFRDRSYPDAISFMLETIRKYPGQITLICVAPLTNVGALLEKDPATFRKLKRVVMMGGSIDRGYGDEDGGHPEPEWNIVSDTPAAQALFNSGVPLYVMPLDSTQIQLEKALQQTLFARDSFLTNDLRELTREWTAATHYDTPTLYDAVATAYALHPELCPMTSMRITVDDKGMTRRVEGPANAHVCLRSSAATFFDFYLPRVTE